MPVLESIESNPRWLALGRVPGLGPLGFKRLIDYFGDPTRAFDASPETLGRVDGLSPAARRELPAFRAWDAVTAELAQAAACGAHLLRYCDEEYPRLLREIPDPPPILFVKGVLVPLEPAIGVVGSRKASAYGRRLARELCTGLAALGICIVSGMARGIDAVAHGAALSANGRTIAVLGSGIDMIYPKENAPLAEQTAARGALVSEFRPGMPPLATNFPVRNRLISGLSLGVVVIEAAERSGSLITARLAAEQGREVFAVPGSVGSDRSRGTHRLIKQGAKLVEEVLDIVEEISPQLGGRSALEEPQSILQPLVGLAEPAHRIVELLRCEPAQIERLIDDSGLSAAQVSEILLDLELRGIVNQLPGKRFELN